MTDTTSVPARHSSRSRKLLKVVVWSGASALAMLGLVMSAFLISGCAAFGSKPAGARLVRVQQSPEWRDDAFRSAQPLWSDGRAAWGRLLFGAKVQSVEPDQPVPIVRTPGGAFATPSSSGLRVTWFGHSSTLVEIDGNKVLIDPLWSERISPVAWAGPKRWYAPPTALADLPGIDVVLISHDHVDHLDYATISAMKSWRTLFVVPLGVGVHLAGWGISETRIVELDWWQSTKIGNLELVATPARHASGRLSTKSNQTLWAGYAIVGDRHRVWYSGDTGFHDELRNIGERLGPFDVTLIEAGQYDANWPDTHLGPELAVEAHRLVQGRAMIPVHWALISLARHAWTEPAERVTAAASCRAVKVLIPRPGESIEPTKLTHLKPWWPQVSWQPAAQRPVVATRNGNPTDRVVVPACSGASENPSSYYLQ